MDRVTQGLGNSKPRDTPEREMRMLVRTETHTRMFGANQTLIRAQWVDKIRSVHTMGYYSTMKRKDRHVLHCTQTLATSC